MTVESQNKTLETNRRPAIPLDAGWEYGRPVHAQPCLSGGGRSAFRFANNVSTQESHQILSPIARLWKELSDAINTPQAGESILSRRATPAWESTDDHVAIAWEALTRPQNLDGLVDWGNGSLNPHAREYTDKAIEVCRSRKKNGEPDGAANGSQPIRSETNPASSAAGSRR